MLNQNTRGQNLNYTMMKKLTNVSPFLLLLVPVFIMMLFALVINNPEQEEVVAKTSTINNIFRVNSAAVK